MEQTKNMNILSNVAGRNIKCLMLPMIFKYFNNLEQTMFPYVQFCQFKNEINRHKINESICSLHQVQGIEMHSQRLQGARHINILI